MNVSPIADMLDKYMDGQKWVYSYSVIFFWVNKAIVLIMYINLHVFFHINNYKPNFAYPCIITICNLVHMVNNFATNHTNNISYAYIQYTLKM